MKASRRRLESGWSFRMGFEYSVLRENNDEWTDMEEVIYVSIKNLSLGYPARRVDKNRQIDEPFKSVDEAKSYLKEHADRGEPWEYEYRYGVERLYVP